MSGYSSDLQRQRSRNSPWRRWTISPKAVKRAKESGFVPREEGEE